ncbi:hypothetical protein Tco_0385467, partial [Tanacetum coccineum]
PEWCEEVTVLWEIKTPEFNGSGKEFGKLQFKNGIRGGDGTQKGVYAIYEEVRRWSLKVAGCQDFKTY